MAQRSRSESPDGVQPFRSGTSDGRWEGVAVLEYKEEGAAPFKSITRQILFSDPALAGELRYFEMKAGGYSTLERHEHVHAVMIHRGTGHCLIGLEVREVKPGDLVFIPSMTWHQFRATQGEALGLLCMVNVERDRPQLPTPADLATLRRDPGVAAFLGEDASV